MYTMYQNATTAIPSSGPGASPAKCVNIPGFMSKESSQQLTDFSSWYGNMHGYVAATLCVIGIITCTMSIIVLTRKNITFNGSLLLTALATVELIKLVIYLPFAVYSFIILPRSRRGAPFSTYSEGWAIYNLYFVSIGTQICHTTSVSLTISLAVFRFIYIWFPKQAAEHCSPTRLKIALVFVILCSIGICTPMVIVYTYSISKSDTIQPTNSTNEYEVARSLNISTTEESSDVNKDLYIIESKPSNKALLEITYFTHAVLLKVIPCIILSVLTVMLLVAMDRAFRFRKTLVSKETADIHSRRERKVTHMLLSIVLLFTFTEMTHAVLILFSIITPCFYELVYFKLGDLLDALVLFSTIVNCSLYVSMGKTFRTTFLNLFCPCVVRNRPDFLGTSTGMVTSHQHPPGLQAADPEAGNQPPGDTDEKMSIGGGSSAVTWKKSEPTATVDRTSDTRSQRSSSGWRSVRSFSDRGPDRRGTDMGTIVSQDAVVKTDPRNVKKSSIYRRTSVDSTSV